MINFVVTDFEREEEYKSSIEFKFQFLSFFLSFFLDTFPFLINGLPIPITVAVHHRFFDVRVDP